MNAVIAHLAMFLASLGVHLPQTLPEIHVLSKEALAQVAGLATGATNLKGLCLDGEVYLEESVNLETVEGRAILAHELTHYAQQRCPRAVDSRTFYRNEARAYQVQNLYLRANNSLTRVYNPYPRVY